MTEERPKGETQNVPQFFAQENLGLILDPEQTKHLLFQFSLWKWTIPITTWTLFGMIGNLLFTTRVVIQWVASERQGKTVVPISFWWLSLSGALVLNVYAFGQGELPFVLGYTASLMPYTRNLIIAYRPDRPPRNTAAIAMIAVFLACIPVFADLWLAALQDIWFYFGMLGTAIFGSRFYLQWIHSESKRRSELPLSFWYASFIGSLILLAYSLIRQDLVFILGFVFNTVPYTRNIILIYREKKIPA